MPLRIYRFSIARQMMKGFSDNNQLNWTGLDLFPWEPAICCISCVQWNKVRHESAALFLLLLWSGGYRDCQTATILQASKPDSTITWTPLYNAGVIGTKTPVGFHEYLINSQHKSEGNLKAQWLKKCPRIYIQCVAQLCTPTCCTVFLYKCLYLKKFSLYGCTR